MAGGRPTDYDPSYCDDVIEYGRKGKSRAWTAAELGICRQTLANWETAHPEFLDAMTRANVLSQQWWEDAGQSGMAADKFNGPVWAKNMANRFREDWRERTEQDINVTDLGALISAGRARAAALNDSDDG